MAKQPQNLAVSDFSAPHARVWAIAGPAILANSSAPLVGLVDTWAIGHIPDPVHLASVGVGSVIFSYIFWTLGFLRMGTTGFIAQAHGQGDTGLIARELVRATLLGLALTALVLLLQAPLKNMMFQLLEVPNTVAPLAGDYYDIRIWATPATLFFLALNGFLIGTARTKAALVLQLVLNISNGLLNLWFVVGLNLGVAGVALGTVIAEWLAVIVGLIMIAHYMGLLTFLKTFASEQTWQLSRFKRLFNINGMIFLRTLLLLAAFVMVTIASARMGEEALAVSHVIQQYLMLMALGLDGFAFAGEALVGAAYGAKNHTAFTRWVRLTFFWALISGLFYAGVFFVFGESITFFLTDIDVIRTEITHLMPLVVLLPIVSLWCYQFDGIYIGMTASGAMFGTMLVALLIYLPAHYYLGELYGLAGLWLAIIVLMASRGLAQFIWYQLKLKNF